ncbi:hypothetical protein CHK_0916 [Christensenella hongkongensis]|uniref:Uncharacterized protein n=1 Tax=Christensenella hongkongensis TaxID=270498 RepID=A0A0M2NGT1_9FIRM|nr:hypothetical protein CHK_0916 [Christensenella hongkongensis]
MDVADRRGSCPPFYILAGSAGANGAGEPVALDELYKT